MKVLYYDCFAGISGDMHLGAMIDAGVDPGHLERELNKLSLGGYRLNICRDKRMSIEGTRVDVLPDDDNRDLTERKKHEEQQHSEHGLHQGHDQHRNLHDIDQIINGSTLPDATKNRAMKMFRLIAEAEAKIHGTTIDKIHFHEVGAVDSIVDITGAAICLEYLKPDRILGSTVELGSGMVRCAHGLMPVPAPATAEILKNIPVRLGTTKHEATTPTGAAILAANVDEFVDKPELLAGRVAYGIGQRDADIPNVLRVFVGEITRSAGESVNYESDKKILIECNIDDMSPELYTHVMETLLSKGASDVFLTPTIMKKGRPALILSVLCSPSLQKPLTETVLEHTSTLGVRSYPVSRTMLERESETITTSLGDVTVKKAWHKGKLIKWKPEFAECKTLADKHGIPLRNVYQIIETEYNRTVSVSDKKESGHKPS